jgi:hypothetical protein
LSTAHRSADQRASTMATETLHATVAALQERVAVLMAELAAERERSAGHHAAFRKAAAAAERERERADRLMAAYERLAADMAAIRGLVAEIQLPALRSILETQDNMAGDVAALRSLLDRVDHERDRADRERDRADHERDRTDHERDRADREREYADSLANLQLPRLRSILETQDSMAADMAALHGLLDRIDHERDRANREREMATLRGLLDRADHERDHAEESAADEEEPAARSWWWPFRRRRLIVAGRCSLLKTVGAILMALREPG